MKLPDFSLDERFLELRGTMGIADSSVLGEATRPLRVGEAGHLDEVFGFAHGGVLEAAAEVLDDLAPRQAAL